MFLKGKYKKKKEKKNSDSAIKYDWHNPKVIDKAFTRNILCQKYVNRKLHVNILYL